MAAPSRPCHWCQEPLLFVPGRGWCHPAGSYQQWCAACHQAFACYPYAIRCPYCGHKGVRDRHCALPRMGG